MNAIFKWYIAADIITTIMSFLTFFAIIYIPNKFYKSVLEPYHYLIVLIAAWFLENGIRRMANILFQFHYVSYELIGWLAWGTAILACVTLGIIIPRLKNLGLINYMIEQKTESQRKFNSVLSTPFSAVIVCDEMFNIVELNKIAEEIFGYKKVFLLGKSMLSLIPERYRGMKIIGMQASLNNVHSNLASSPVRIEALMKDGTEIPIELAVNFYRESGKLYFVSLIRDLSVRQNLERENENLKQKITSGEIVIPRT